MASIFRPTYVRTDSQTGKKVRRRLKKWYIKYRDADGILQKVPGFTDKAATRALATELERKAEWLKVTLADPFEEQRKRPLVEHLADYRRELETRDNAPRYVAVVFSRLEALIKGCGFRFISDLSASRATDWLADLRHKGQPRIPLPTGQETFTRSEVAQLLGILPTSVTSAVRRHRLPASGHGKTRRYPRVTVEALQDRLCEGASVVTANQYLTHLKSFCRWLVRDRRMAETPFAHLEAGNAAVDRRHDRRELETEELRRLLEATRTSERSFRGLSGLLGAGAQQLLQGHADLGYNLHGKFLLPNHLDPEPVILKGLPLFEKLNRSLT